MVHPTNRPRRAGWLFLTLPMGLTTWAAFLWAGLRTKRRDLLVAAAAYGALATVAIVSSVIDLSGVGGSIAGGLFATVWVAGIIHALSVRRGVALQLGLVDKSRLNAAKRALARRDYGRQLFRENPPLARQLGVGRPDIEGADSFGLVDVNHAVLQRSRTFPDFQQTTSSA